MDSSRDRFVNIYTYQLPNQQNYQTFTCSRYNLSLYDWRYIKRPILKMNFWYSKDIYYYMQNLKDKNNNPGI